ncbi:MAG: 4-hydroxy-tetrahydrodipicolinate synthase [Pseudomonadota bacterium]|nr:4-hydroxy-tetrahydrodipicolinate synthase [Pseudomonadota bacterium]MEC8108054.1 4-hydroxy-tetrahydrodipicolinate synthase [Pseudomonadota bacterium]
MKISGAITALATPMKSDGTIDFSSLKNLIEYQISEGINALVSVGTTGESATVDVEEHLEIIKFFIEVSNGRIPIIAGTGANSTQEAITLTNEAKKLGADAALLVSPYYNKPTQEGLFLHFSEIAEKVDLPQIIYNVPSRTASNVDVSTVGRLCSHKNIIGIKDATGDMGVLENLQKECKLEIDTGNFSLYSGDDETSFDFILKGGHGTISVTSNILPKLVVNMYEAAKSNSEEGKDIKESLRKINKLLFLESNPIPVKYALHLMGLIDKGIRLPLTWLDERFHSEIQNELKVLKLI